MCHLILLMPVLALPVFWLLPPGLAIPVYMIIGLTSGFIYWLIARSMGKQSVTGSEGLIGAAGEVVSSFGPAPNAKYLVRSQGELWSAISPDLLLAGEMVSVASVDGIRLVVRRSGSHIATGEKATGKQYERHYH